MMRFLFSLVSLFSSSSAARRLRSDQKLRPEKIQTDNFFQKVKLHQVENMVLQVASNAGEGVKTN